MRFKYSWYEVVGMVGMVGLGVRGDGGPGLSWKIDQDPFPRLVFGVVFYKLVGTERGSTGRSPASHELELPGHLGINHLTILAPMRVIVNIRVLVGMDTDRT